MKPAFVPSAPPALTPDPVNGNEPEYRAFLERERAGPLPAFGKRPEACADPVIGYDLPVEAILALPTSTTFQQLIERRRFAGGLKPIGQIFHRGGRFFAVVSFQGEGIPDLMYALDLWTWEQPR